MYSYLCSIFTIFFFRYIKAAKIGDLIEINADTVKVGKSLAFLEVVIKNKQTGDVLVKGSHTKFLLTPKG